MQTIAGTAARFQQPNPQLTDAVVRLGVYVRSMPERMQNDIARMPAEANIPNDLPAADEKHLAGLIQDVLDAAPGYAERHPDYGPRVTLHQALSRLRETLSVQAIDTNVYDPALRGLGYSEES